MMCEKIDYSWIIRELSSGTSGSEFFEIYSELTPEPYSYTHSPLYLHYFRFFVPVEYHHPQFAECDEQLWSLLFQLLFGNPAAECSLVQNGYLLELKFHYRHFGTMLAHNLTLETLKPLLLCLLSDAFAIILPHIATPTLDPIYSSLLPTTRHLYKEEDVTLYSGADKNNAENIEFAEQIYKQLSHYYSQISLSRGC